MIQLYKFVGSHLAFARHHFLEGYRSTKQELHKEKFQATVVEPNQPQGDREQDHVEPSYGTEF